MTILLKASGAPIKISLSGNISEIDYTWKINPVRECLESKNINKLYYLLYRLKQWAIEKGIQFKLTANWLFKSAFYFFCKKREQEEA